MAIMYGWIDRYTYSISNANRVVDRKHATYGTCSACSLEILLHPQALINTAIIFSERICSAGRMQKDTCSWVIHYKLNYMLRKIATECKK
jgi:hypothetical protein